MTDRIGAPANRSIVEAAIAAFLSGDHAAVLAALDREVEVRFHGPSELPIAGRYHGHAGFLEYLSRVLARIQMLEFSPDNGLTWRVLAPSVPAASG